RHSGFPRSARNRVHHDIRFRLGPGNGVHKRRARVVAIADEAIDPTPGQSKKKPEQECFKSGLSLPASHPAVLVKNQGDPREKTELEDKAEHLRPEQMTVEDVNPFTSDREPQCHERCKRVTPGRWMNRDVRVRDLDLFGHYAQSVQSDRRVVGAMLEILSQDRLGTAKPQGIDYVKHPEASRHEAISPCCCR